MANVTKSVIAGGGGDYTTIAAAEAASDVSTGWYKIEIQDNSTYTEAVNISGSTGTDSATNYVWLTVAAANRHSGSFSGTHAKMANTSTADTLTVSDHFTRIEYMHIRRAIHSQTDVQVNSCDGFIFSHCLIGVVAPGTANSVGQLRLSNFSGTSNYYIDNCVIVGSDLCMYSVCTSSTTMNIYVDYCTFARPGTFASTAHVNCQNSGTAHYYAYNNIYANNGTGASLYVDSYTGGVATIAGSNNLRTNALTVDVLSIDNSTNWQYASSGVTTVSKTSGSWLVVTTDADADTGDYSLLDDAAGNLAANNGTNRIGSEPDSRQDFSVDIAGNTRGTTSVDIGAYTFGADATATSAAIAPTVALSVLGAGDALIALYQGW